MTRALIDCAWLKYPTRGVPRAKLRAVIDVIMPVAQEDVLLIILRLGEAWCRWYLHKHADPWSVYFGGVAYFLAHDEVRSRCQLTPEKIHKDSECRSHRRLYLV